MVAETRAGKAHNVVGQNNGPSKPQPKPVKANNTKTPQRTCAKKVQDNQEKVEKVEALQEYQQAHVTAYADSCTMPAGPSITLSQGEAKPTSKGALKPHNTSKPTSKPEVKTTNDRNVSTMKPDAPPVFSGMKRTCTNLSVDLSAQVSLPKQL